MKKSIYNKSFFEKTFSEARMRPYFNRYPCSESRSIRHYKQNISLAEALGPSLSVFEVSLRNALIRELERMAGKEWYKPFRIHPTLKSLYKYISTASKHIKARGEQVTLNKNQPEPMGLVGSG